MNQTVVCDQLFVNDTNCDNVLVEDIVTKYMACSIKSVVVSKEELQNALRDVDRSLEGTIILPGNGGLIAAAILDFPDTNAVYLPSITRKLAPGSMSPRGIEMSEQDRQCLSDVIGPVRIVDDVVASGSTINGIYKRLSASTQSTCSLLTLVLREPTNLREAIPVTCGIKVRSEGGSYPRINTLSSLMLSNPKRDLVLSGRKNMYGARFAQAMSELFIL